MAHRSTRHKVSAASTGSVLKGKGCHLMTSKLTDDFTASNNLVSHKSEEELEIKTSNANVIVGPTCRFTYSKSKEAWEGKTTKISTNHKSIHSPIKSIPSALEFTKIRSISPLAHDQRYQLKAKNSQSNNVDGTETLVIPCHSRAKERKLKKSNFNVEAVEADTKLPYTQVHTSTSGKAKQPKVKIFKGKVEFVTSGIHSATNLRTEETKSKRCSNNVPMVHYDDVTPSEILIPYVSQHRQPKEKNIKHSLVQAPESTTNYPTDSMYSYKVSQSKLKTFARSNIKSSVTPVPNSGPELNLSKSTETAHRKIKVAALPDRVPFDSSRQSKAFNTTDGRSLADRIPARKLPSPKPSAEIGYTSTINQSLNFPTRKGKDENWKPCKNCTDFKSWTKLKNNYLRMKKEENPSHNSNEPPLRIEELGRNTWYLLHSIAANYSNIPTKTEQKEMSVFISTLAKYYPCAVCAKNFQKSISLSPPETQSRWKFSLWLCKMHNEVNRKLGKEEFDCGLVDQRWKEG